MITDTELEFRNKILLGLKQAYEKMLEFKKQKNSVVVVMRDNKILKLKPEEV